MRNGKLGAVGQLTGDNLLIYLVGNGSLTSIEIFHQGQQAGRLPRLPGGVEDKTGREILDLFRNLRGTHLSRFF